MSGELSIPPNFSGQPTAGPPGGESTVQVDGAAGLLTPSKPVLSGSLWLCAWGLRGQALGQDLALPLQPHPAFPAALRYSSLVRGDLPELTDATISAATIQQQL